MCEFPLHLCVIVILCKVEYNVVNGSTVTTVIVCKLSNVRYYIITYNMVPNYR